MRQRLGIELGRHPFTQPFFAYFHKLFFTARTPEAPGKTNKFLNPGVPGALAVFISFI
jgi:hypothetical protein